MAEQGVADGVVPEAPRVVRRPRRRPQRGSRPELGYQPSLDGVRALAVAAVLVYHARFDWAGGGFLGVSTFFTLSGFLITSLMLQEWHRSGAIDVRGFFARRWRRLLPASWLTLALVVAMGAAGIWNDEQMRALRGDVPWSLAQLVNWHFIFSERSYGDLFTAPSPLEHFWSLAVEEQFYVVMPLLVAAVLGVAARRASRSPSAAPSDAADAAASPAASSPGPGIRPLVVVFAALAVASLVMNGLLARGAVDRAYFGTGTRAAELLLGALLACAGMARVRARTVPGRLAGTAVGLAGLAVTLVLWHVAAVGAAWMYPWGFALTAVASVAVIVGALQAGPLARLLSLGPLVWLGRISYGVYLLHWPVFLWLTPARVGWGQWPLFGLRMSVTLVAAVVMFRLVETPVRSGQGRARRWAPRVALPVAAALVVGTAVVTDDASPESSLEVAATATTVPPPPPPTRVLVVGDELAGGWTAAAVGTEEHPLEVTSAPVPSCGVALGGWVRLSSGAVERDIDRCAQVRDQWVAAAAAQRPDVVVVWSARRDVTDRRLDVRAPWMAPGSAELDDFLVTEVSDLLGDLAASGASVMVATAPRMSDSIAAAAPVLRPLPSDPTEASIYQYEAEVAAAGAPGPGSSANDPARIDRWNQILAEAAARRGAGVLDLAAHMRAWPGGELDPERRAPDGVGLTPLGATELSAAAARALHDAQPTVAPADPAASVAAAVTPPPAPPVTPRRTAPPGRAVDVFVAGDSVGFNVGYGLGLWSRDSTPLEIHNPNRFGCPIARGGDFRFLRNPQSFAGDCDWSRDFPDAVDGRDPEVVVLMSGIWEVVDRRLAGDDRYRHIGDPLIDNYLLAEFISAIDLLGSNGASVMVLTYPHFEAARDQGYTDLPESDPARVDRLNELLRAAAAARPGVATLVDFQAWLAARPGGELDPAKRTDGLHFRDDWVANIGTWLGPQVVDLARSGQPAPASGA
jgi:peptidoglycan/LPS O-acetylase OafA/YrhL